MKGVWGTMEIGVRAAEMEGEVKEGTGGLETLGKAMRGWKIDVNGGEGDSTRC